MRARYSTRKTIPRNTRVKKPFLTPIPTLLVLLFASGPLAADQPIFTASDPVPGAVDPGYEALPWPDAADTQSSEGTSPLDRWTKQAEAGRARAAAIVGRYWLERVSQEPEKNQENCAKAIEWYTKAEKLGSNEAAGWLGHLYRRFDCPQRNVKVAIEWLRKAVPLMSYGAASDLSAIYSAADAPEHDAMLAYAYARVAAASGEFPADDAEAQGRVATLEQGLDARQKKSAAELADKLLAGLQQRRAAMTAAPREEKLKPAAAGSGWTVGLVAFDELRECAANTAGNCKGVRRNAYYDAANTGAEYLRCKLALDHRDFALGTKVTNEREFLVPPRATRRMFGGRIGEVAGSQDLRVSCTPLAGLAANVAAGKCRVTTTGVPSVADFYPPASKRRNEQGRVVLNVWMDKKEGNPAIVELKESSGFPDLDRAGVLMGTYMAFRGECEQGYTTVAVSFRLQD
jgi:TonB family protein